MLHRPGPGAGAWAGHGLGGVIWAGSGAGWSQAVHQAVTQVDATLVSGFTVVMQGMAVLAQLEKQEIQL